LDQGWSVGTPAKNAATSELIAPATTKHHRLRRARRPAKLPAGFGGEVEELSFADHLGAIAGGDLQVAGRRNDAFPGAPAREIAAFTGSKVDDVECLQLAPGRRAHRACEYAHRTKFLLLDCS